MIHADSKATNLVDQKSFYVGISRAKESVAIFTDDRGKLISAISERAGQLQTAIAPTVMPTPAAGKAAMARLGGRWASITDAFPDTFGCKLFIIGCYVPAHRFGVLQRLRKRWVFVLP